MYRALSNSYVMPAIFLNPVLFLISLNTILSRVLPPITVDAAQQPPPYSTFGPSAQHPHLDIHASEKLCWSYTFLIVCAQLAAFQKVSECREESRLKARRKWKRIQAETGARKDNGMVFMTGNGCAIRVVEHGSETRKTEEQYDGSFGIDPTLWHLEASDEDSAETNDSETIL